MASTYGSKRLVVGAHYGLRDWLVAARHRAVMALFTLAVIVQLLLPADRSATTSGRHLLAASG